MKNRVVLIVLGLVITAMAGNAWLLWGVNPLLVVRAEMRTLGWEDDSLSMLGGGYRSSLLELHAYARYKPRDERRGREVYVEIARTNPLQAWQVVEYRIDH